MIYLPNVTLLLVNGMAKATHPSNDIEVSAKVLSHSSKEIEFGAVKLFNAQPRPANLPDHIEYIKIPVFNLIGYSKFIFHELVDLIDTDFVLIIQNDGFVLNPDLWTDDFLKYDYIGAPWTWATHPNVVGNGGFSLRSKKILYECQNLEFKPIYFLQPPVNTAEDVMMCCLHYEHMLKAGVKYAPVEVAARFSLEHDMPGHPFDMQNHFGFHGVWQTPAFPMYQARKDLISSL